MNSHEKPLFHRIQTTLAGIAAMAPSNPCDVARKSIAGDLACRAATELYHAIGCIGFGDYGDASERVERAEAIISERSGLLAVINARESK